MQVKDASLRAIIEGNSVAILGKQALGYHFAYLWAKHIKQHCQNTFLTQRMKHFENEFEFFSKIIYLNIMEDIKIMQIKMNEKKI